MLTERRDSSRVFVYVLSWHDFCAFVVSMICSDRSICYGKILFGFFDPGNEANEVYLIHLLILLNLVYINPNFLMQTYVTTFP